jgi:phosphoenolpyruvate phosphomutase
MTMPSARYQDLRSLLKIKGIVRIAGAHSALGARIAEESGFDAIWSSSLEVSAARCLPDASLLSMAEYVDAARHMQSQVGIPVVADVDTGYGNNLNVAHMVHEYEAAGITAVCMEDKVFPKINSFVATSHSLVGTDEFASKIAVAKSSQRTDGFMLIARTEALIDGRSMAEALGRCEAYVKAGADALLVHSKKKTNAQIVDFMSHWQGSVPIIVVPTTYPSWNIAEIAAAGISAVIYANQGLRATITALRSTYRQIIESGSSEPVESLIASVRDVFALQDLEKWTALEPARD